MTPKYKQLSQDLALALAIINDEQDSHVLFRSDKPKPINHEFAIYMIAKDAPDIRLNDPKFEGRYAECFPCEENPDCMEIGLWRTLPSEEDVACMFSFPIAEVLPETARDVYNFLRSGATPSMYTLH